MRVDRILGLGAICLGVPVAVTSWRYDVGSVTAPGPGFWPFCVTLAMAGLGATLVLRPAPAGTRAVEDESRWAKFGLALASLIFYVLALEPVGYLATTAVLLLVQLRWVEDRSWRASVVTALVAAALSLVVFRTLLKVPLPLGALPLPRGW
jgi:hypothetical protein